MGLALVIKNADFQTNKLDTVTFIDNVPCTGITLNQSTLSLNTTDEPVTLIAAPTPSDTTDSIRWSSSNTSVATAQNGVITPIAEGAATITATCGGYSATCLVNVAFIFEYVLVSGYDIAKASSTGSWAYVEKKTGNTTYYILAGDNSDTTVNPVPYDETIDTSPYRFVPLQIPSGVEKIILTSTYAMLTRFEWFDSTRKETYSNYGAYLVEGLRQSQGFDQGQASSQTLEIAIPSTAGIDSFAATIYLLEKASTAGQNLPDLITVSFE